MDEVLINLYDYERAAKGRIQRELWDFIAGGAHDEITVRRNRSAFEALTLHPRYLRDITERDLSTTLLGSDVSMPIVISPAGLHKAAHPDGELATAAGAGMSNALFIVPTGARGSCKELAEVAAGPLWLQLYHMSRQQTEAQVREAEDAGFKAICLTVDVPVTSWKECDRRNGFDAGRFHETGQVSTMPGADGEIEMPKLGFPVTWNDVEWLRGLTTLPVVLKGLTSAADARLAVESGVEGIFVSTHGGRLLDSTMSSIESLPEVIEVVGDSLEVFLDSGVRRGTDVLKALALGARGVGIGRPFYWGLAVDGASGVHAVLETLRAELDLAMAYCGQTSVRSVERDLVGTPPGWGRVSPTPEPAR